VCARVRDETRVRNNEKYGPKIGSLGFWMGKILTLTLRPLENQSPPKHAIWHKKNGVDPLKNVVSESGQEILFKKLKNNPN